MNSELTKKEKSTFGTISLVLFSLNVLFYVLHLVGLFLLASDNLSMPFRYLTPTFALLGIITGAIAGFTRRSWKGLVLNVLFICALFITVWLLVTTSLQDMNL